HYDHTSPPPFPATILRARVFAPFVIIFDHGDEITTLPVRPSPPSPDRTPALYGYPLDSGDDSSDDDLSKTADNHAFFCRPGTEITMPLGYRAAMDRWRAASPSTYHPLPPSEIPSLSSPPSLLPSSSLPSPLLLPSSSRKGSRSPLPLPPPTTVPPPLEHIVSVEDNIEASIWDLERHLDP
nr:hypothetical protein [Tanacetum cinerariifolium]